MVLKLLSDDHLHKHWFPRYSLFLENKAESIFKTRPFQVGELKTGFVFWLIGCSLAVVASLFEKFRKNTDNFGYEILKKFRNLTTYMVRWGFGDFLKTSRLAHSFGSFFENQCFTSLKFFNTGMMILQ